MDGFVVIMKNIVRNTIVKWDMINRGRETQANQRGGSKEKNDVISGKNVFQGALAWRRNNFQNEARQPEKWILY